MVLHSSSFSCFFFYVYSSMFSQHHGEIIPPKGDTPAGRMSFLWASPGGAGTAPPSSVEPMVAAVVTEVLCLQLVEYCLLGSVG